MELKQALIVRADLKMGKGKVAAQVSHASVDCVLSLLKKDKSLVEKWIHSGMKKVVLKVFSLNELIELFNEAKREGLCVKMITDAGRTQLPEGTTTVLGIGPDYENKIDKICSKLKMF